jgi:hypothetical protein
MERAAIEDEEPPVLDPEVREATFEPTGR